MKMKKSRSLFMLVCLTFVLSSGKAQSDDSISLSNIIFHASRCNGTCPRLDLEIDSSKGLYIDREYFKSKGETDPRYSGQFKGTLTEQEYHKLIELLQDCNVKTLKFPASDLMDGVVITIIIYFNGQRKYLKSAEHPVNANGLLSFLTSLSDNKKLDRTNEIRNIEE
jgi:Domain of unknown function (DUF6438)